MLVEGGPVGCEVISLQKVDSLLVFQSNGELKRFMQLRAKVPREKVFSKRCVHLVLLKLSFWFLIRK
jgi:hypothetical protein